MELIVEIKQLTKTFKQQKAVDAVSFSIKKGEVVAILGPNGAGKTTTMSMMLGLLHPTEGESKLFGEKGATRSVRERIGVMLQEVSLMDGLKVKELIQLFRHYYPAPLELEELIKLTRLNEEELSKRTEKLSGGQKRRVGFALALAGDPDLLFFDEPTVGMDITSRKAFWETVKTLAGRGKTIIFSTHYLQEADDIADRIILFNQGRVIADDTPKEIKKKLSRQFVSFLANDHFTDDLFRQEESVKEVFTRNGRIYLVTDDTDAVLHLLFEKKIQVQDIQIEKGRLDEAFEQLVEPVREVG